MNDGGAQQGSIAARRGRRNADRKFDVIAEQYCGILNQGATCYMNSILQALFHLPAFRKLVYDLPLDVYGESDDSIIWNIKKLFSDLQTSSEAVSTKALTDSFGWGDDELLVEQDTHEFMKMFLSSIDECLKNTEFEHAIEKLFLGRSKTYFLYANVARENVDEFLDLQLAVEGCSDLDEAIRKYTEPEHLVGDNQYLDDVTGKRYNAIRKCELIEIPSVLFIQLERFRYDREVGEMIKVNSVFAFPEEIDMNLYVAEKKEEPDMYKLYGVVVHSGDPLEGHFRVFLRTSLDDRWYEFNDSVVKVSSSVKAMEMNFGGEMLESGACAYVLIYVREADVSWLFSEVPVSMIPKKLLTPASDRTPMVHLNVWTEKMISAKSLSFSGVGRQVDVRQGDSLIAMYQKVANAFKKMEIRLWYASKAGVSAMVPFSPQETVESSLLSTRLFVEDAPGYVPQKTVLLLTYFYYQAQIVYVSTTWVQRTDTLSSMACSVLQSLGIPDTEPVLVFVKSLGAQLIPVDPGKTFLDLAIRNGSHIVIQPQFILPEKPECLALEKSQELNDFVTYYDIFPDKIPRTADTYFQYRSNGFKAKIATPGNEPVPVFLPSDLTWDSFKKFVSGLFDFHYDRKTHSIEFYLGNALNTLDESGFATPRAAIDTNVVVTAAVAELHSNDEGGNLRVIASYSEDGIHSNTISVWLLKYNAEVVDLIAEVRAKNKIPSDVPLRALQLGKNRIICILSPHEPLCTAINPIRVEPIPVDERDMSDGSFFVYVECAQTEDPATRCPSPFVAKIALTDSFSELAIAIRDRLGMTNEPPLYSISDDGTSNPIPRHRVLSSILEPGSRILAIVSQQTAVPTGGVRIHK